MEMPLEASAKNKIQGGVGGKYNMWNGAILKYKTKFLSFSSRSSNTPAIGFI